MDPGRGLLAASTPPFSDAASPRHAYNPISAGGPQIKIGAGRSVLRARLVTTKLAGLGALECLCTDLRFGAAALRRTGQQVRVITNLPPLPADTSRVDVELPGLTTLTDLAVTPAPDSTFRSAGPAVRGAGFWTYREQHPHPAWRPGDWPTPSRRTDQLRAFPGDGGRLLSASVVEPTFLGGWRRSGACIARPTREGYRVVSRPRRTQRGACLGGAKRKET